MAKGLGIASLAVAVVSVVVPLLGLYLSAGAIVLAVIAALAGDRAYAAVTPVVAVVNVLFLSPFTWLLISDHGGRGVPGFYGLVGIFFAAPFVAMLLNAKRKVVIR